MSSSLIRKKFLALKFSYLNKLVDIYHNYSTSNSLQVDTFRTEHALGPFVLHNDWNGGDALLFCPVASDGVRRIEVITRSTGNSSVENFMLLLLLFFFFFFITWLSETRKVEIMQLKSEAFAIDNNLWYIVIDTAILVGEAVSKDAKNLEAASWP